jgi:hypothetical protein
MIHYLKHGFCTAFVLRVIQDLEQRRPTDMQATSRYDRMIFAEEAL